MLRRPYRFEAVIIAIELDRSRDEAGKVQRIVDVVDRSDALRERVLVRVDDQVKHAEEDVRHPDREVRKRQECIGGNERIALQAAECEDDAHADRGEHHALLAPFHELHAAVACEQERRERRELPWIVGKAEDEGEVRDQQNGAPPAARARTIDRDRDDCREAEKLVRWDVHFCAGERSNPLRSTAIDSSGGSAAVSSSHVAASAPSVTRRKPSFA